MGLLADLIVAVHVVWVGVVVLGVPLILIGGARGWRWVRNRACRMVHLGMIAVVVLETVLGITCPLTTLEHSARRAGGAEGYDGSFIGHWLHELIYFDAPPWVFDTAYVVFGVLVLSLWWLVPPKLPPQGVGDSDQRQ